MSLLSPTLRSLLEDNKCDEEFCYCITSIPDGHIGNNIECPLWLTHTPYSYSDNSGASLSSIWCAPKTGQHQDSSEVYDIWGAGDLLCMRFHHSQFDVIAVDSMECIDEVDSNNNTYGKITQLTVKNADGLLFANNNESFPIPECPLTKPDSFLPTMSPTIDSTTNERLLSFPLALVCVLALILW